MTRVLILGDNLKDLNYIENALSGEAECDFAFDCSKALAKYDNALRDKSPYDHIIVDEDMIKNSLHSFVEYVRGKEAIDRSQEYGKVPISVLTKAKSSFSHFYSRGCSDYITKPLEKEKIISRLQTAV